MSSIIHLVLLRSWNHSEKSMAACNFGLRVRRKGRGVLAGLALGALIGCSSPADDGSPMGAMGGGGSTGGTAGQHPGGSAGAPVDGGTGMPDGAGAVDAGPATLIDDPLGAPPMNLADVGIFTAMPDTTKTHARAFYYEPKHPLWSNGLDKSRFMVLPQGKTIDTTVRDGWDFPVGTLFFKTFSYQNAAGKLTPVETRLIRRVSTTGEIYEQWEFYVYQWNAEATAATLADIKVRIPRDVFIDGKMITHNIPKQADCWNCHIANKSPIIGFDELRLNSRLTGQTAFQLDVVIGKGWLTAPPPKPWVAITDPDPLQEQAFQYIQANCVHCHNGEQEPREPGARYPKLDLRWDHVLQQTINKMTETVGTGTGIRIVPGDPSKSLLYVAMSRQNVEVKPMPLVGVDLVDAKGLKLIGDWITALKK